jgi:uncharacterized membrane protein YfcA
MNARILTLILLVMLAVPVLAVPSTPTVSLISGANATFTSTGASTTCWFQWGVNSVTPEWTTINTTTSGTCTGTQYGSPYFPNQNYNVQCCDVTGCSATTPFTSGAATPIPQTTFGAAWNNITANNYAIPTMITQLPTPLLWEFSPSQTLIGLSIIAAMFLMFYFVGLWLRQRRVELPVLLFMILLTFLISPLSGFGWGMPQEYLEVAQITVYIALTGIVVSLFKKG